jgi:hypothetical protein
MPSHISSSYRIAWRAQPPLLNGVLDWPRRLTALGLSNPERTIAHFINLGFISLVRGHGKGGREWVFAVGWIFGADNDRTLPKRKRGARVLYEP